MFQGTLYLPDEHPQLTSIFKDHIYKYLKCKQEQ